MGNVLKQRSQGYGEMNGSDAGNSTYSVLRRFRALETTGESSEAKHRWQRTYCRNVAITDTMVVVVAVAAAQFLRFGTNASGSMADTVSVFAFSLFSLFLAGVWLLMLQLVQSRDPQLIGNGADEYRRVISATGWLFGFIAVVSLILGVGTSRSYLAIALPIGMIGLLVGRRYWRRTVGKRRMAGECTSDVIVVGSAASVASISDRFDNAKDAGYRVVAACVPDYLGPIGGVVQTKERAIPIVGNFDSLEAVITVSTATTVAVAAVEQIGFERMRGLAWTLDKHKVDLVVSPGVVDVAGPRLKIRPIDNLPFLHVDRPRYDGPAKFGKAAFDKSVAVMAVLTLAPVLVAVAMVIKLGDRGPVFFRQERVGLAGERFKIWKFRTMVVDADKQIDSVKAESGMSESVFYKSANDSRITPIGRFLRKTSLDEIPQLFNVLAGHMSIVGPRPLVPGEGSTVRHFIERRALVKPGVTGLWQVSGRSDVSEEERIRLDHYYVDNWSVVQDAVIVWRTAAAVIKSRGAY